MSATVESDEYGYGLAYRLAWEQLSGISDLAPLCARGGAEYLAAENSILVTYLNRPYRITIPGREIVFQDSPEGVPLRDKILLLHYLNQASGNQPSGTVIAYKELPEGVSYFRTFAKRAINPLVNNFGDQPEHLLETAVAVLGGRRADYGDLAVTVDAFPKVPITLVLWRGDAEFPPEGNILFDRTITGYLTTEDINVLCETIAWKLVKTYRAKRQA
jgi:hypothetical protein